jgi:threonine dehydratase
MKGIFEETKSILEPAGVLALASMTFPLMSMRQPSVQGRILH